MIKTETLPNGLVRTYSDLGFYIFGGYPESMHEDAIDPVSAGRTYVETDIPIPTDDDTPTEADYALAGKILLGEVEA